MARTAVCVGWLLIAPLLLVSCASLTAPEYGADQDALEPPEDDSPVVTGIENLTRVSQLTGPDAQNDTMAVGVAGTDLGSMINVDDRTYFLFGDTFGERDPDSTGGQGTDWRSNVLAWTSDDDPTDGITFDGWALDEIDSAVELLESQKQDGVEMTKIPTHGFAVGDALYIDYMSVRQWGEPGEWEANHASLAKSLDQGQSWEFLDDVQWAGDSNFVQVSAHHVATDEGDEIWSWGIPAGRSGGVQLMKVPAAEVESPEAYRYFTGAAAGTPQWSADPADASMIIEGGVGEPSVIWNEELDRWLIAHQRDNADVVLRESPTPWGPWSEPQLLVSAAEHPGLYGPYLNERYLSNDGTTLHFALSLWDPYNVFWFSADLLTDS